MSTALTVMSGNKYGHLRDPLMLFGVVLWVLVWVLGWVLFRFHWIGTFFPFELCYIGFSWVY
jgi:hypothetical protein